MGLEPTAFSLEGRRAIHCAKEAVRNPRPQAMACPKCAVNPAAHSFHPLTSTGPVRLYYTAPAKATEILKSHAEFVPFKTHLDTTRGSPWIWLFDCKGMGTKHLLPLSICKELMQVFVAEHGDNLQAIWVLNPNSWFRGMVGMLKPFFKKGLLEKIQFLDGDTLEVVVSLEKRGVRGHTLAEVRGLLG